MIEPRHLAKFLAPLLAITLAACGDSRSDTGNADELDNMLAATNEASAANDPALRTALRDPIMVDPALVQQANADVVRPPAQPASGALPPDDIAARGGPAERDRLRPAPAPGPCPQCAAARRALTLGALAEGQHATGDCVAKVRYSAVWANRLPPATPLYPDARVIEAAGADGNGCALRIVNFASGASLQRLLAWYYTKAGDAGLSAQHGMDGADHVLAASTPGKGALFVMFRPRAGGGTEVDLIADRGN
ncbi:hypothetical protein ACM61V_17080 [Sphingomonas sp. TX0543]|uniref:hypothetical protein n=1 Tax=unclassified Sphingomonas TaxID=196159 RepID=UPI0010F6249E|nr:hypothetical protein [Sphingomonas sp. 3P27F8]